jgi:hypothetical protein
MTVSSGDFLSSLAIAAMLIPSYRFSPPSGMDAMTIFFQLPVASTMFHHRGDPFFISFH